MNSAAASGGRPRLGEILVSAGLLSQDNLQKALEEQKQEGEKLGFVLITKMYISEGQLVQALSKQLSVPWVSLTHLEITKELMKLVPQELVAVYGVVPVYIMSRRPGEKILYVAMDDPTNEDLLAQISSSSGMGVKPMIAAPSEIATAVRRFYRTRWDTGERLVETLKAAMTKAARQVERPSYRPEPEREPEKKKEERPEEIEGAEEAFLLPESAVVLEVDADEKKDEDEMIVLSREAEVKQEPAEREESRVKEESEVAEGTLPEEEVAGEGKPEGEEAAWGEEGPREEERPAPASAPGPAVSFTFLDGTKLSFGAGGVKLVGKTAEERELFDRILRLMKKDRSGRAAATAVTGIIEILLRRGLMTFDEMQNIIERLEKH
jgi:hypothetical protein